MPLVSTEKFTFEFIIIRVIRNEVLDTSPQSLIFVKSNKLK